MDIGIVIIVLAGVVGAGILLCIQLIKRKSRKVPAKQEEKEQRNETPRSKPNHARNSTASQTNKNKKRAK